MANELVLVYVKMMSSKINRANMQNSLLGQSVIFILVIALVTGCAASKEYTTKIFPNPASPKDSQAVALRFLELDGLSGDETDWVSTDIITGRDTTSRSLALDKFSEIYPAKKDSLKKAITLETKTSPVPEVAKTRSPGEVRQKRSRE